MVKRAAVAETTAILMALRRVAAGFSRLKKKVERAPRNPYGIRKVIISAITMVAAIVMRPITHARPGYGVSSVLRNRQNHAPRRPVSWGAQPRAAPHPEMTSLRRSPGSARSHNHGRRFA